MATALDRELDQVLLAYGFLVAITTGVVLSLISNIAVRKFISFSMAIFIGLQVLGVRFLAASTYQFVAYISMCCLPRDIQH